MKNSNLQHGPACCFIVLAAAVSLTPARRPLAPAAASTARRTWSTAATPAAPRWHASRRADPRPSRSAGAVPSGRGPSHTPCAVAAQQPSGWLDRLCCSHCLLDTPPSDHLTPAARFARRDPLYMTRSGLHGAISYKLVAFIAPRPLQPSAFERRRLQQCKPLLLCMSCMPPLFL